MRYLACALALSLAIVACGSGRNGGNGTTAETENCRTLAVVDSFGVEMGDSSYMFGSIEGLRYDQDGNIVLLDRAFSKIRVYSPRGEFIREIGGHGSGPGEMSLTVSMALTGNGDLLVTQRDAMERFDYLSGDWIREYPRGATPPPFALEGMPDSTYVGVHLGMIPDEDRLMGEVTLGIYAPGSLEPMVTLDCRRFELNPMNAAFLFEDVFEGYSVAVDSNTVYVAPRSGTDYEVTGFDFQGNQVFHLTRDDLEPVEMSPEELREEKEYMEAKLESMGAGGQMCSPDPLLPMVSGLGIGPEGNLWVRRGTIRTPFFDIYDPSGELVGTATLATDPEEGRYMKITVQPQGLLAYSENPATGFQRVYVIE